MVCVFLSQEKITHFDYQLFIRSRINCFFQMTVFLGRNASVVRNEKYNCRDEVTQCLIKAWRLEVGCFFLKSSDLLPLFH